MKVDKDLIEKYHRQECTAEETEAVEQWLFSGESDEALQLPAGEDKAKHKAGLWKEISSILPEEDDLSGTAATAGTSAHIKRYLTIPGFWTGTIAASVALVLVAFTFYHFGGSGQSGDQFVSVDNHSAVDIRHIRSADYDISVGPNTKGLIDRNSGTIDLSGSMVITPSRDVELTFGQGHEKITFKTGETYIVLNDLDGKGRIIIVNERNLTDLPPVIQKQIINQFKI